MIMYFAVKARFNDQTASEFFRKLTDGTIQNQKPDGNEIVKSMHRAKIDDSGVVRWSEVCYCSSPLQHERQTVYDHHFTELETEEIEDYIEYEGESFFEYLQRLMK